MFLSNVTLSIFLLFYTFLSPALAVDSIISNGQESVVEGMSSPKGMSEEEIKAVLEKSSMDLKNETQSLHFNPFKTRLTNADVLDSSVTLKWESIWSLFPNLVEYEYQITKDGNTVRSGKVASSITSVTVGELDNGGYSAKVRPIQEIKYKCGFDWAEWERKWCTEVIKGSWSNSKSFTINVDTTPPNTPTGLYFKDSNGNEVQCGGYSNTHYITEYWSAIKDDPTFDHYEYSSFNAPDGRPGLESREFFSNSFDSSWWEIPSEGTYGFQVRAVDKVGNKSEWSGAGGGYAFANSCKVTIDWTAPTAEIKGIRYEKADVENFITNTKSPLIYGTYGDNVGVEKVVVNIGGTDVTGELSEGGVWTAQFSNLSDDKYEMVLTITDKAGNTATVTEEIVIDTVAPTAKYTEYKDGEKITDKIAYVKNIGQLSFTAEYSDKSPSSGLNFDSYVIFQAQDDGEFGFSQNGKKSYCDWRVEKNSVDISSGSVAEKISYKNCIESLPDGEYYMAHQVYDNAVRNDIPSIKQFRDVLGLHFIVDSTAPLVNITSHSDNEEVSGTVDIKGTVKDDNLLRYYYAIIGPGPKTVASQTVNTDDSFTETTFYTWNTTEYEDGEYEIRLEARDRAGNKDSTDSVSVKKVLVKNSKHANNDSEQETPPQTPSTDNPEVLGTETTNTTKNQTRKTVYATTLTSQTSVNVEAEEEEEVGEDIMLISENNDTGTVLGALDCEDKKVVKGYVYTDKNGNKLKDEDEKTYPNTTLKIYTTEGELITEVKTDEQGYYELPICIGEYRIEIDKDTLPSNNDVENGDDVINVSVSEDVDELGVSIRVNDNRSFLQKNYPWIIALVAIALLGYVYFKKKEEK